MKYQHTFIAFVLVVISAISAFAQQNNDSVEIQGYQFASASKGDVKGVVSPTMEIVQDGGKFEKLVVETTENQEKGDEEKETLSLLNLAPGDFLDCRFKLPETAFDVKATIVYKGQDDGVKGRIRWNKTLLPEDQAVLLKEEGTGLVQKVISLEKFQRENELRIFSLGESLQILNVKITYSYRMPSCTVGDVTVKLLSPDSDKDVLGSDLKIAWAGTGPCDKGWVTLKYKDGEEWKTVPGAESFDLGDEEWKDASHGQFVWKNHGLKAFPELKIVYSEDESPKHREARLAAEAKAKAEQAERERKAQADQIAKEAQKLLQNKKYDEALAKIGEALNMFPDNDDYKQIKKEIDIAKDPFSTKGRKAGDRTVKVIEIGNEKIEFTFCWCPAGTFMMGSPVDEAGRYSDEQQHQVTLDGFWMMETEVTQKQWKAIMGNNPSEFRGDDLPVENVSWYDSQDFCMKTQKKGLPIILPTEAQWEYACRAGTTTAYHWGNTIDRSKANFDGRALYSETSFYIGRTTAVRKYKPNAWGLFDMHGNVIEWCNDWFKVDWFKADNQSGVAVTNPQGPPNGIYHVSRGGGCYSNSRDCRSAYRGNGDPLGNNRIMGFRCVVNPE